MTGFETIEVTPITGVIGAEISGVDLRRPLRDTQRDEIHEALMRHLVLFFRGQELTEDEQLAFGAHFGPPVTASIDRRPGADELLFVSLEDNPDSPPKADRWHTDVPFVPEPPDIAILHMQVSPPVGGDTMWASLYGVYDALSPTMQSMIAGLELELDLGTTAAAILELYGQEYYDEVNAQFDGARHPLVRVHPVTGRPAVYLCGSMMTGIAGMHPDEAQVLLNLLSSKLDDPNLQVRWRWQQHDLAMWDERCTNHRALSDHYPSYRMIRRCLIGEGRPISVAQAASGSALAR
jgi:taurine dioxygenase